MRAVLILVLASGCSFLNKPLDKAWDRKSEPDCTDTQVLPVLDAIGAGIGLGLLIGGAKTDSPIAAGIGGVAALGFAIGAVIGGVRVDECKTAKTAWMAVEMSE
ncbi:MAG: hypothetical protein AB7O24_34245 [Kofleriaceae bacterium]